MRGTQTDMLMGRENFSLKRRKEIEELMGGGPALLGPFTPTLLGYGLDRP